MYTLQIRPRALEMMQDAYEWYEQQQDGLGEELLKELDLFYHKISTYPKSFGKINKKLYKVALKRFPYIIVYEIVKSEVVVFAVFHTKRNPKEKFR